MDKNNNWFDNLLLNKWFYIVITLFFIGVFGYIFKWQHYCYLFDEDYIIDNNLLGTFGDFIGGVLGTIFALISILILIRTFSQQRAVTIKNTEQIENQRFNDLFFELLRLYQSEIAELCGSLEKDDDTIIDYNNKDFFDYEKEALQRAFTPTTSYEGNMQEALKSYMFFYIEHRTKIAACFRTLYRIYDLLDKSELSESIKKNYLKILRAQLTDSELFFIRYNAITYYGHNFIRYINKYNILKHLPTFELLEFKDWWKELDKVERMGINIVFHYSTRVLRRSLERENDFKFRSTGKDLRYKFEITTRINYEVEVTLTIDSSKENKSMEFIGFDKFSPKRIQALLDCFLKETFIYSNFKNFNIEQDVKFYSNQIKTTNDLCIIHSAVKNIKHEPLKIKQISKL